MGIARLSPSSNSKVNRKMAARYTPRFARAILAAALFILALTAQAAAQTRVRLCWTSFASNMSGSWVAYEEGFFKKNGLDVELIHIPSTSRAIQAMLAGAANRFVFSFMARPEIKKI